MRGVSILGVAFLLVFTSMIPMLTVSADEGRNPNRLQQSGGPGSAEARGGPLAAGA
jgi:hypothetical protein